MLNKLPISWSPFEDSMASKSLPYEDSSVKVEWINKFLIVPQRSKLRKCFVFPFAARIALLQRQFDLTVHKNNTGFSTFAVITTN